MNTVKPEVLVLGVTGEVGRKTARLLAHYKDVQVVAGVRSPEKAAPLAEQGIEICHLDFDRHETPVLNSNSINDSTLR